MRYKNNNVGIMLFKSSPMSFGVVNFSRAVA